MVSSRADVGGPRAQPVMGLPGLERLVRIRPETWHGLSDFLTQLELRPERVAPLIEVAEAVPEVLRVPLLHYRLRRAPGGLPLVLRLLCFGDRVELRELSSAFGHERLDWLKRTGLVEFEGENAHSPFEIGLLGSRFILADPHLHPGDVVMGAWRATGSLLKLAFPSSPVGRALDLGCGAGALALGLSSVAERVVMTDIYPRAVEFGRINLALNHVSNVEARVGDLYEPVAGETFDLIVCQPPFVSAPPDDVVTYLHGGSRGDELERRILEGLVQHLAPQGRAFLYLQLPNDRASKLLETVRGLIGPRATVLLIEDGTLDLDEYCAVHEAPALMNGYDEYASRVQRRREHLDRMGISTIATAYLVVVNQQPAFTQAYQASGLVWGNGSNADVEALLAGLALAHRSEQELLSSKISFRGEPSIIEIEDGVRIECPPLMPLHWERERFGLLHAATRASTVAELRKDLELGDERAQELARELADVVREAARTGLVVPRALSASVEHDVEH